MTDPPPTPAARAKPTGRSLPCAACGYDLRGVCTPAGPLGGCPECGEPFAYDEVRTRATWRDQGVESIGRLSVLMLLVYPWPMLLVLTFAVFVTVKQGGLEPAAMSLWVVLLVGFAWLVNLPMSRRLQRNWKAHQDHPDARGSTWARRLIPVWVTAGQCVITAGYFGGCMACLG